MFWNAVNVKVVVAFGEPYLGLSTIEIGKQHLGQCMVWEAVLLAWFWGMLGLLGR